MEFKPTKSHRFHLLDALRGIAALLVVPRHVAPIFAGMFPVSNSFLAVDFFFCLSGFVIAYSYEERLCGKINLRDFMAARIIRLYPLAVLATSISLANLTFLMITGHVHPQASSTQLLIEAVLSLLLLPNFWMHGFGPFLFPFDSPIWSLFFELLANLGYAWLVIRRFARTWMLAGIALLSFISLIAATRWMKGIDAGSTQSDAYLGLARVSFSFCVGVFLFRLHRNATVRRIRGSHALFASFAIILFITAAFTFSTNFTRSGIFSLLAIAVLFPAIVHLGSKVELPPSWTKPCVFLGDMSYPLYVLHAPLLSPLFAKTFSTMALTHPKWVPLTTTLIFAATAYFCFWLVKHFDVPVRKFLTTKYSALTARPHAQKVATL